MSKVFRILSIDGGGIRGVYPAHILRCIEERLQINLCDKFDMVSGTSTGSIIAAGVVMRIPASKMVEMYKEHGEKIFRKKRFTLPGRRLKSIQSMFGSIYDAQYLKNTLKEVFQNKCLGEIKKPLLIPSTDVGNGCVHVLKSGYSNDFNRDNSVLVRDAVMASCAAPIYFDPHRLNEYLLSDGGLWANNPALAAVIDAQKRLGIALDQIKVLSLGTGHSKTMYGTDVFRRWGLLNGWKHKEFINFIFSLQSQSTLNYLKLTLHPEQVMRVDFESDFPLSLDDASLSSDFISKADHQFTHKSESIGAFLKDDKCR